MYARGQGVPRDDALAVKWYRVAADQGHALAQNNLGVMHSNGRGVSKDAVLAYRRLNLAAAQGQADAAKNRDRVAKTMTPAQIAEAQRLPPVTATPRGTINGDSNSGAVRRLDSTTCRSSGLTDIEAPGASPQRRPFCVAVAPTTPAPSRA